MSRIRSFTVGLVWVALAVVIAAGIAGLAATINRTPGTPAREELTWVGDHESEPALDDATVKLQSLSDRVDELGATARDALVNVTTGDTDALQQAIAAGTLQLDAIDAATSDLQAALVSIPHAGPDWPLEVSAAQHQRYTELEQTAGLTAGLEDDWAAFTGRAAGRRDDALAAHAPRRGDGVGGGRGHRGALPERARPARRVRRHDRAGPALRDRLAKTSDVATLTRGSTATPTTTRRSAGSTAPSSCRRGG